MAHTYLTPSWVIAWNLTLGSSAPSGIELVGVTLTITALILLLKNQTNDDAKS